MSEDIKKYLGIDWGAARIGLAMGDSLTRMSLPYKVVGGIDEVIDVIKSEDIDGAVVGEPVKMSGSRNNMTAGFYEFVKLLESRAGVQVIKVDERLTSKAADSLEGNKKTKAPRDTVAAMLILQSYLDS